MLVQSILMGVFHTKATIIPVYRDELILPSDRFQLKLDVWGENSMALVFLGSDQGRIRPNLSLHGTRIPPSSHRSQDTTRVWISKPRGVEHDRFKNCRQVIDSPQCVTHDSLSLSQTDSFLSPG